MAPVALASFVPLVEGHGAGADGEAAAVDEHHHRPRRRGRLRRAGRGNPDVEVQAVFVRRGFPEERRRPAGTPTRPPKGAGVVTRPRVAAASSGARPWEGPQRDAAVGARILRSLAQKRALRGLHDRAPDGCFGVRRSGGVGRCARIDRRARIGRCAVGGDRTCRTAVARGACIPKTTPTRTRAVAAAYFFFVDHRVVALIGTSRSNRRTATEGVLLDSLSADQTRITRSAVLPSLAANVSHTQIDASHANPLLLAQRTSEAGGTARVPLYRDSAWAGWSVSRHLAAAANEQARQELLDTLQQTATAYFSLLRAKSVESVRRQNVENHASKISKPRVRVRPSVYRRDPTICGG